MSDSEVIYLRLLMIVGHYPIWEPRVVSLRLRLDGASQDLPAEADPGRDDQGHVREVPDDPGHASPHRVLSQGALQFFDNEIQRCVYLFSLSLFLLCLCVCVSVSLFSLFHL